MPGANYQALRGFAPRVLHPWLDRIQTSPIGSRLARGMFWSAAGALVSRALALVASIIIARKLGQEAFGEFGMIQSTLSLFATFAIFGVGLTATKYVAELRKRDPERAGRIIAMTSAVGLVSGVCGAVVLFVSAPWVSARLIAAPHLAGLVALSALALVFHVQSEAQIGTLSGLEAFKRRSTIQVIAGLATFPITIAGVCYFGLVGAVWGLVISSVLLVALNNHGIRKEAAMAGIPIWWKDFHKELRVVWRFSLPTLCCGAVYVPAIWVANTILVNSANGYGEMGVFSAADRWRTAIMFLPSLLGGVALPMLSSLAGDAHTLRFRKVLWTNVTISFFIALAVAAPIALLAPWIMACYGRGFEEGAGVLATLCVTSVVGSTYWIVGQSLVSRGRLWTMFHLNLAWAILFLTCAWFARGMGAQGLAFAYLLADSLRLVTALLLITRRRTMT